MRQKGIEQSTYSKAKQVLPSFSRKDVRIFKEGSEIDEVELNDQAWKQMYQTHLKIGATNELPTSKEKIRGMLTEMYRLIFAGNNRVPDTIPFEIIWPEFSDGLVRGDIERKGNNMGALCEAFNKWITKESVRKSLTELYYFQYPDAKPKQLSGRANYDPPNKMEVNASIDGQPVEKWSADAIKDTLESIQKLSGGEAEFIAKRMQAGKFMARVMKRAEELGIEV
jgi:hypothetical protein